MTCLIIAIVVVVCFAGLLGLIAFFIHQAGPTQTTWPGTSGEAVGVVRVTGVIMSGGGGVSLFGVGAGSESITSQIRRAAKDGSVKALVIRINSPGGSAAASQEIYQAIREYRKDTHRPVVASMGDVAASGGYYLAAAADKIMAAPATMTGSIGVIMETIQYSAMMEKIGVSSDAVTSGRYKDMGSPFRRMRPDERQLIQAMIDDVYDQFVEAVVEGRGMKKEQVKRLADGRIYTGRQAQKVKLVDQLGTFRDSIRLAAKLANIKGEPTVKFFERVSPLGALFGDLDSSGARIPVPAGLLFDRRLWPVLDPVTVPRPQVTGAER